MKIWQLIFCGIWMFTCGAATGFIVHGYQAQPQGVISCTGYQQANMANILIKGNGLFNSNLDARMAAEKIARVICVDTSL